VWWCGERGEDFVVVEVEVEAEVEVRAGPARLPCYDCPWYEVGSGEGVRQRLG
jgi:hypothetical protein